MSMVFLNSNLEEGVDVLFSTSIFKNLGDNGYTTLEDVAKQGKLIGIENDGKDGFVKTIMSDLPHIDFKEGVALFIANNNGRLAVETRNGWLYAQTDQVGELSLSKTGFNTTNERKEIDNALSDWIGGHHTGLSSLFMASYLLGTPENKEYNFPHDPDDLSRCINLIESVSSIKEKLPEMANAGPEWSGLISQWDELVDMFHHNDKGLYDAMQSAIESEDNSFNPR
jgi:hypothetical protein